jgi:hypothetical protein
MHLKDVTRKGKEFARPSTTVHLIGLGVIYSQLTHLSHQFRYKGAKAKAPYAVAVSLMISHLIYEKPLIMRLSHRLRMPIT